MAKQITIDGPVDSGSSKHVFSNKDVFQFYTNDSCEMEIASGESIISPGSGKTFNFISKNGNVASFNGARHVLELSEQALFLS
jgi:urease beta subunit